MSVLMHIAQHSDCSKSHFITLYFVICAQFTIKYILITDALFSPAYISPVLYFFFLIRYFTWNKRATNWCATTYNVPWCGKFAGECWKKNQKQIEWKIYINTTQYRSAQNENNFWLFDIFDLTLFSKILLFFTLFSVIFCFSFLFIFMIIYALSDYHFICWFSHFHSNFEFYCIRHVLSM